MGDSSFGDETQYHPSEHSQSRNQHVSRYEHYRTSDVHGSTADSGSGHDKYENVITIVMYEGFQVIMTDTMIKVAAVNERMYLMVRTETATDTGKKVKAVNVMKMSFSTSQKNLA